MFATVPGCSEITCKSTECTHRMFVAVRGRSWRVGVPVGVHYTAREGPALMSWRRNKLVICRYPRITHSRPPLPHLLCEEGRQKRRIR
jgi:hypothetical protein